jgi:hypothetical protein
MHRDTISGSYNGHSYQPPYESTFPPSSLGQQPPVRVPRYSIPTSSSGFVPLPNPTLSGFAPLPSHSSEPSGFPPPARTPAPMAYTPSHYSHHPGFAPAPSQTPLPGLTPPIPPSSTGYQPTFQYSNYVPQPSASAPPQQYNILSQSPSLPQQAFSQTSLALENIPPPPPLPQPNSLSLSVGSGSRPLPLQPQIQGQSQVLHQPSFSQPPSGNSQQPGPYSPTHPSSVVFPAVNSYQSIPPPPPLPSYVPSDSNPQYPANAQHPDGGQPRPPPPPPPPTQFKNPPSRRASLPQPPINYQQQQQFVYQPVPPPPPPDFSQSHPAIPAGFPVSPPPPPPPPPLSSQTSGQNQSPFPGPPPRHPQINDQSQWLPNGDGQHQGSYGEAGQS